MRPGGGHSATQGNHRATPLLRADALVKAAIPTDDQSGPHKGVGRIRQSLMGVRVGAVKLLLLISH